MLSRAHVCPNSACGFYARIGDGPNLGFEGAAWQVRGHVDTLAVDIKLPAVIDAHQPTVLIDAKEQRRASDAGTAHLEALPGPWCHETPLGPHLGALLGWEDRRSLAILQRAKTDASNGRRTCPIGVPGPTRHNISLSSRVSMLTSRQLFRFSQY